MDTFGMELKALFHCKHKKQLYSTLCVIVLSFTRSPIVARDLFHGELYHCPEIAGKYR